ncbi:hypothetical protein BLNAU_10587 [Blattamonas nauphoetae]|uniref:Uncharacterized protein n=1 Tax=Blattamonas nauphoetae TaxID=2049346 RepID=A0ABQ9XRQ9_9EUKA|nr:hypothetical protein BLNAU_10587 [Blattamonas nauphoetae]
MIDQKTAVSSSPTCPDGSAFLNWSEEGHESEHETAVVFRSLVATLKMQPALDVSLEVKAVKFLESVNHDDEESADAFLGSLGRASDESSTEFLQSIRVLFSSTNLVMTTAAMKMLESLILYCSAKVRLAIVNAGFLSQLIMTLNPQSLSLVETGDLHLYLLTIIRKSLWLTDPIFLAALEIQDDNEQQAVHEMGVAETGKNQPPLDLIVTSFGQQPLCIQYERTYKYLFLEFRETKYDQWVRSDLSVTDLPSCETVVLSFIPSLVLSPGPLSPHRISLHLVSINSSFVPIKTTRSSSSLDSNSLFSRRSCSFFSSSR